MSAVDDPQLEVLLACFDGHKRAGKAVGSSADGSRRAAAAILDEVVVRVNHKGAVHIQRPAAGRRRHPDAGAHLGPVRPARQRRVERLADLGGGRRRVRRAVRLLHRAPGHEERAQAHRDALVARLVGAAAVRPWRRREELLDDVAPEHPRLASVATIGADLSATVAHGAADPVEVPSAAAGAAPPNRDALLNMLVFRYPGADAAARVNATRRPPRRQTKQPTVQTELLMRADKSGRYPRREPRHRSARLRAERRDRLGRSSASSSAASSGSPAAAACWDSPSTRRSPGSCGPSSGSSPARSTACGRAARSRRGG